MGAQASVLGNHQIAVLDASTEEADGPGCTVANHCYYGHTVGATYGKSSCEAMLCGSFTLGNQNEKAMLKKWRRNTLYENAVSG